VGDPRGLVGDRRDRLRTQAHAEIQFRLNPGNFPAFYVARRPPDEFASSINSAGRTPFPCRLPALVIRPPVPLPPSRRPLPLHLARQTDLLHIGCFARNCISCLQGVTATLNYRIIGGTIK
jgi:hypothetical protein